MDQKLIAAALMSLLSLGSVITIVIGLAKLLPRTGWSRIKQQKVFTRVVASIFAWIMLVGFLAIKGFFSDFSKLPPRPMFVILLPLPLVLFAAFSKNGTALLKITPPQWLIGIQAFRILVELLLFRAVVLHLLPVQMSFEGYNFDIVSGLLALVVAILLKKKYSRQLVLAYNIIGLLLLLNILVIAVLSMPTPFRKFLNGPANTLVTEFPFIYLPAILVVIAYSFHIFSIRQLALRSYEPRTVSYEQTTG
ncbi:MAG: hypothetical protein JO301_18270 [Chitinophagaceae bacterium]|nr:hypothetical protein [Chitinophagaceae bacterium]